MERFGIPKPPILVGEEMICLEYFDLGPFKNLQIILLISFLYSFSGRGRMVAMCLSLDKRQVLVILFLLWLLVSWLTIVLSQFFFIDLVAFS